MSRRFVLFFTLIASSSVVAGAAPSVAELYKALYDKPSESSDDYRALRDAYALSPTYNPDAHFQELEMQALSTALQNQDFQRVLTIGSEMIKADPTNTNVHWAMHLAYVGLKDPTRAALQEKMYDGLNNSILAELDKGDAAEPMHVVTKLEVYSAVAVLGGQITNWIQTIDGCYGYVDLVYIKDSTGQKQGILRFEVNAIENWLNAKKGKDLQLAVRKECK